MTEATARKLVARSGKDARIGLPVHPHMLRRATGFYLANNGVDTRTIQAYLGHRNIMHTVRYTQRATERFRARGVIERGGEVREWLHSRKPPDNQIGRRLARNFCAPPRTSEGMMCVPPSRLGRRTWKVSFASF
jgi:integrase-like protein